MVLQARLTDTEVNVSPEEDWYPGHQSPRVESLALSDEQHAW